MKRIMMIAVALAAACSILLMTLTTPAKADTPPLPTAVLAEPVIGHQDYEQYLPAIMTRNAETK